MTDWLVLPDWMDTVVVVIILANIFWQDYTGRVDKAILWAILLVAVLLIQAPMIQVHL